MGSLEEWGLAGRSFGTWITWFLIGGDLYTAYTVIAVPAALYGAGAIGFFAVPYAIIAYPYMMLVLPRLWTVCHRHGYVTFADFVSGRYGNRWLTVAIALTGVLALMPYIALQLVGIRVVISSLGIQGEWPLATAFIILAAYTYSSGLRAPAVIAIVKDVMLYIMVLAALIVIPIKLGGYARIFELANQSLALHTPPATIFLRRGQFLGYSTLAIGSAIALMLYPHTATAVLSAKSANVVRRNAAMLPAYSFLLGLIALLGYLALAAGSRHQGHQRRRTPPLPQDVPRVVRRILPRSRSHRSPRPCGDHVHRGLQSLHPKPLRRLCPQKDDPAAGIQHGEDSLARSEVRRPRLRPVAAHTLRDRDATPRRHLDRPDVPLRRDRRIHALVPPLGARRRLGRRHGKRHSDGIFARSQELRLSVALAPGSRRHIRNVRGGSGSAAEPDSLGRADA